MNRQPDDTIYGPVFDGRKADGTPVQGVLVVRGGIVQFQPFAETPPTKTENP